MIGAKLIKFYQIYLNAGEAQMDEQALAKRKGGEFESPLLYHFMALSSSGRTIDSQSIGRGSIPRRATNFVSLISQ